MNQRVSFCKSQISAVSIACITPPNAQNIANRRTKSLSVRTTSLRILHVIRSGAGVLLKGFKYYDWGKILFRFFTPGNGVTRIHSASFTFWFLNEVRVPTCRLVLEEWILRGQVHSCLGSQGVPRSDRLDSGPLSIFRCFFQTSCCATYKFEWRNHWFESSEILILVTSFNLKWSPLSLWAPPY